MPTLSEIKCIKSLYQKKHRKSKQKFVAEGIKICQMLAKQSGVKVAKFFSCQAFDFLKPLNTPYELISNKQLSQISQLKTPQKILALCDLPKKKDIPSVFKGITLVLDGINDPGNLGTLLRLADWFGVSQILCSFDTVDVYNPKTIQASMGSFMSVSVYYTDLNEVLKKQEQPIYGTVLVGNSVYQKKFPKDFFLIFGSEAHGIRSTLNSCILEKIHIPSFAMDKKAESLNVAMAAAIILALASR